MGSILSAVGPLKAHTTPTASMEKGNDFPSKDSVGRLRRHACLVQVEFLQQIYDSLKARQAAGSAAVSSMDLGSIFMAGHSRGGKLAALHFAAGAALT